MIAPSLNALAEARELAAWETWPVHGRPAGYFAPGDASIGAFFAAHGFVVIETGADADAVAALRADAAAICRGDRGAVRGIEPAAADETDDEVMRRYLCIHFPHKISATMTGALTHPAIVDVLTTVIGPNVKAMQSMLFIKASGKPGQAWHQDEFFIPTRDRSLTGAWIAMDDATVENGCLWVIPGSHRRGVIYPQHAHHDRRFDCTGEAEFPYTNDDAVPVEVRAGSIVFFNGYLLHRSLPNYATGGFRRALVNHYMSAESLLPWMLRPEDGHIGIADFRDIVLVAGSDPYAFKGTEERTSPHVRPSGEGGCGNSERNATDEDDDEDHHHM